MRTNIFSIWIFITFYPFFIYFANKPRHPSAGGLYPKKHLDEISLFPYNSGNILMKGKTEMDSSSCDDCDTHNFIMTIHGIPGPATA